MFNQKTAYLLYKGLCEQNTFKKISSIISWTLDPIIAQLDVVVQDSDI